MGVSVPITIRLLSKIRYEGECWRWTGFKTVTGYGHIWGPDHHSRIVHRVAYELFVGPIPYGLTIDHVKARGCRFRDCVNPAHLEAVTNAENILRGDAPSAKNRRKTHCPLGHALIPENLLRRRRGSRECRACHRIRERRYKAERRRQASA